MDRTVFEISQDTLGNRLGVLVIRVREDDAEFITAHPRGDIALPHSAMQRSGDHSDELITCVVPKGIVHGLEFVDVDCKKGVHGASRHAIKSVVNLAAIGDPGKLICCRLSLEDERPRQCELQLRRQPLEPCALCCDKCGGSSVAVEDGQDPGVGVADPDELHDGVLDVELAEDGRDLRWHRR